MFFHDVYQQLTHDYLMDNAFMESRTFWFANEHYCIPELGVDGDLRDLCKVLINIVYQFNADFLARIDAVKNTIDLPKEYVGLHIRRGDKIIERAFNDINDYIKKAMEVTDIRHAFVATDDYAVIEELRVRYKEWSFYTLTQPDERGFVYTPNTTADFDKNLVKMFAFMDILAKSTHFVGTVSSNPGMFLGMWMDRERVHYVDSSEWIIL